MSTFQALQFEANGPAVEVLKLTQLPKPSVQKDTEYLVKIHAAAINPSDVLFVAGRYLLKSTLPSRAGFEGSGIVEEAGKSAGVQVGQKVHARGMGTWGEYILCDATMIPPIPLPEQISFEEGAQITVNPITVMGMLLSFGVQKGEYVLQSAASSALGKILIQIAKLKGFKTINIVRRDDHIEPLKALGADYVINSEKEDLVAKVKEIVPEGVKYAVDAVAGKTGSDMVLTLASRGTMYVYGSLSASPLEIPSGLLIAKRVIVTGFWLTPWMKENPAQAVTAYKEVVELLATKKLVLESKTFDGKTQFADAVKHSQTPGKSEKSILLF